MSSLFLNIYVRTSASTPIIAAFSGVLWDRRAFGTSRRLQHPSVRLDEVLICSVLGAVPKGLVAKGRICVLRSLWLS